MDWVCKEEGENPPGEVLGEISEVCKGSSREALVILGKVIDISDPGEALQIVAPSTEEAIDTPQLSDQEKEEAPVILGQVIDISDPGEALQKWPRQRRKQSILLNCLTRRRKRP